MLKRVVITGIGGISSLGDNWQTIRQNLLHYENTVRVMPEWDIYKELNTRLASPIDDFAPPAEWTRKQLRSMGRLSQMCVKSAEQALIDAGIRDEAWIRNGCMGVSCGSSIGSTKDIRDIGELLMTGQSSNFNANTYVRMMPHTSAANIAIFFGLKGRIIPTSSACASGNQGIGYAYESIKYGMIPMMLAGGGEELCPSEAFIFDTLYAASTKNDHPKATPAPYDQNRDGLVIGEGACILVLEEYEHAVARGAKIYAEIVGYGSNCDGQHVTRPARETMAECMRLALHDAKLPASEIGYVNGHGTATEQGDIAETCATADVFGYVPLSSQKSYIGHTLGACGSLETWFSIQMMLDKLFMPTLNLNNIDPRCGEIDYIQNTARQIDTEYVINNNFAFGGVNSSLILKKL